MASIRSAAIFAGLLLCSAWSNASSTAAGPSDAADAAAHKPARTLSASLTLADWSIESSRDIAYVSVGILRTADSERLVIYDIRERPPITRQPKSAKQTLRMVDGHFLLDHFDRGIRNRLGGYSSPFARAPSSSELAIEDTPDGTRALAFRYLRAKSGFTGFWIHLFDFKSPERTLLDARKVAFLTFRVRGLTGNERIVIRSADDDWERRGDSLVIDDVGSFVKTGTIGTQWQQAWVPLSRLPERIDRSSLASFVFSVEQPGSGTVFIKDMALAESRDAVIPEAKIPPVQKKPLRKAMWVWETEKIAAGEREPAALVEFCRAQGITDVYLQIPDAGPARLRHVVAALHEAGVRVDALDGHPRFALEAHHAEVLDAIEGVVTYNETAPDKERYDGIRYDNEPYLLPGFAGVRKKSVLRDYLRLIEKARAVSNAAGLSFGVDIPFWFDARDRFLEPVAELDGRPVSELVIDRVDNLAIMDYRTSAYGPDGVIEHASAELAYATRVGKPVYVGLETVVLPDETILEFGGEVQSTRGSRLSISPLDAGRAELRWIPAEQWTPEVARAVAGDGVHVLVQSFAADAPSSKMTFAGWRPPRLERVIAQTTRELSAVPSFAGFAIHSYESYRPWLATGNSAR